MYYQSELVQQLDIARDEVAHLQRERSEMEKARREAEVWEQGIVRVADGLLIQEKLQNINITVTEATSKNKIVSKVRFGSTRQAEDSPY